MITEDAAKLYVCPGQTRPISRSVHLARMAAFYPGCRDCALRHDVGQLPRTTVEQLEASARRIPRSSLVAEDGLRGEYVNEIDRTRAERIAERFADHVWAEHRRTLGEPGVRWSPRIVVARDERASSPDIALGVVAALRRMGCRVVDVHTVPRPVFGFAVDHLNAHGGIHVTGAGSPAAWTGLDFVVAGGPIVAPALLASFDPARPTALGRPTRVGGDHQSFEAIVPYEAGLWRHFHALRPLTVVCGSASGIVRGTLRHLFTKLPCRIGFVELPTRRRDVREPDDADVLRVGDAVRRTEADLGIVIDEDGGRAAVLDERGRLADPNRVAGIVAEVVRRDDPDALVLDEPSIDAGAVTATMLAREAAFVTTTDGRCWFRGPQPTCDAIQLLARVLSALSRDDTSASSVLGTD